MVATRGILSPNGSLSDVATPLPLQPAYYYRYVDVFISSLILARKEIFYSDKTGKMRMITDNGISTRRLKNALHILINNCDYILITTCNYVRHGGVLRAR